MSTALVLPSPFQSAHVHAPFAAALGRRGWGVLVSGPPATPRDAAAVVRSRLGAPAGWRERPSAHLAFGSTYEDEVVTARSLGWPVEVLEGAGRLHHLVDPDAVATATSDLVSALEVR